MATFTRPSRPVSAHPVQADGGVFDKVGQFTLSPTQLFQSI